MVSDLQKQQLSSDHAPEKTLLPERYIYEVKQIALSFFRGAIGTITTVRDLVGKTIFKIHIDPLTGVGSRHAVEQAMRDKPEDLKSERGTSILMLDLDHFKWINDSMGHQAGDRVLSELGAILNENLRKGKDNRAPDDVVGRYGGEEFIIILKNTDAEGAKIVAERIRKAVETKLHIKNSPITISIGVANIKDLKRMAEGKKITREDAKNAADAALYMAKLSGRNRAVGYQEGMEIEVRKKQIEEILKEIDIKKRLINYAEEKNDTEASQKMLSEVNTLISNKAKIEMELEELKKEKKAA